MSLDKQDNRTERAPAETVKPRVLIVGAGAAGVRASIELVQQGVDPSDLLVVGKRSHGDAHTTWARGGINGALGTHDSEDDWTVHAADTLNEGHMLNDPAKVERVAREMPDRLRELDEWGMPFSRTDDGQIDQRFFGAQSFRRTAFAGDHTGESMLETLIDRAQSLGVPYREHVLVTRVLSDDDTVRGAAAVDQDTGEFVLFESDAVVLAAGGYAGLFSRHSSRDNENTGDGPGLALAAGAQVMDTEFVQFHPTGMAVDETDDEWQEWAGRLVTEAVRGEGGRLYNADGERFMERYSPKQMELDARDVVARAIAKEIAEGRGTENGGVLLDISHREESFVRERLPRMFERYESLGVNLAEEPVEVAPTSHYGMGGVVVDETGETRVDGLYAVGETMAGVHGANRLGGNSLAETVAFGRVAGEQVAARLADDDLGGSGDQHRTEAERHFAELATLSNHEGTTKPESLFDDLRALLWDHARLLRDEETLSAGLDALDDLREQARDLHVEDPSTRSFAFAVRIGFALTVAETILRGALRREESRGAHHRTDFPDRDPNWRQNIVFERDSVGGFAVSTRTGRDPSDAVQAALDADFELDYHQLE